MVLKLINYAGANGTGKSTRTYLFMKYLEEKYGSVDIFDKITKKGVEKEYKVGKYFSNGWFVLGTYSKNNTQWVSLDNGNYSKWEDRINFISKKVHEIVPGEISVFFMEGYFNNPSKKNLPKLQNAVDSLDLYISYYDDISEFMERTNGRTGRNRGLDWAENSAGWRDNASFKKFHEKFPEHFDTSWAKIERLPINSPKDFFVQRYFGETYEIPINENEVKNVEKGEWF